MAKRVPIKSTSTIRGRKIIVFKHFLPILLSIVQRQPYPSPVVCRSRFNTQTPLRLYSTSGQAQETFGAGFINNATETQSSEITPSGTLIFKDQNARTTYRSFPMASMHVQ